VDTRAHSLTQASARMNSLLCSHGTKPAQCLGQEQCGKEQARRLGSPFPVECGCVHPTESLHEVYELSKSLFGYYLGKENPTDAAHKSIAAAEAFVAVWEKKLKNRTDGQET
jgi:hypothetical protein